MGIGRLALSPSSQGIVCSYSVAEPFNLAPEVWALLSFHSALLGRF